VNTATAATVKTIRQENNNDEGYNGDGNHDGRLAVRFGGATVLLARRKKRKVCTKYGNSMRHFLMQLIKKKIYCVVPFVGCGLSSM
jgi:hypothetical protein